MGSKLTQAEMDMQAYIHVMFHIRSSQELSLTQNSAQINFKLFLKLAFEFKGLN